MNLKNKLTLEGIITATIRDAKTGEVKRVYKKKNTIQLAGRAVIARIISGDGTYTGEINYGVLYTTGPVEDFRKLTASATYDDATAKAYVSFFYTAGDTDGTFTQFSTMIDGEAGSGTGQEWTRVAIDWTKTDEETLTVDCEYTISAV